MSVLKYKDPETGEIKKVGAPKQTITPASIGAAALGEDGKVLPEQLPDMSDTSLDPTGEVAEAGGIPAYVGKVAAPAFLYGTEDLEEGVSPLADGVLYFYSEE